MALTDPIDTLAYHSSRALSAHRDMSEVPCKQVAAKVRNFLKTDTNSSAVPENEALWFYGLNHGMALISADKAPLQPLDDFEKTFVNLYYSELSPRAVRAFYYVLMICTREARHNLSIKNDKAQITSMFGAHIANFFVAIKGGESSIHNAFLDTPPAATIGAYVKALQWQFYHSKWSGGYGGKAWGKVTDCLVSFVTGEYSAEMMLDTVWTLSHNNGPIFNKGLMYDMYNPGVLIRILDIQRSGQIPQAILHDKAVAGYADVNLAGWMKQLTERFPEEIGAYVDWEVVEALGSVHKYPSEKKVQFDAHGMSPAAKKAKEQELLQKKAAEEAAVQVKIDWEKNWFEVMPGTAVQKIQINRAA